ncbi:hypothetical protein EDB89DRAFT_1917390 [Lactarius sanguifluus]|nr:hypothetical protein EDB89DRAFT_1917390 [Lactarius sanguifluus]
MRGRVNEVGGDDSAGVEVVVEAVLRRRRCSGVEVGGAGGSVAARWRRRGGVLVVPGQWSRGGVTAMLRWQGQGRGVAGAVKKMNSSEWGPKRRETATIETAAAMWPAYTHVSGTPGGLGARMPQGVKGVGGGRDDKGDTVLACTG